MNERLHELARQAKIEFTLDPTESPMRAFVECWEDELAKFAELIVLECAQKGFNVFDEEPDAPASDLQYYVRDGIKEHFGVEE